MVFFEEVSLLFDTAGAPSYSPANCVQVDSFFPTPRWHLSAVVLSSDSHSDLCEVFPHCGFDLCSCDECRASFRMSVDHMYVFGKMSIQVSCSFEN